MNKVSPYFSNLQSKLTAYPSDLISSLLAPLEVQCGTECRDGADQVLKVKAFTAVCGR